MNGKIKIFPKISFAVFAGLAFFFFGLNLSLALDLEPATGTKALSTDWSGYTNIYINDGVTVTLAAGTHDLGAANLIVNSGGIVTCAAPAIASISSVAIGTGAKTFYVAPSSSFSAGQNIYIFYDTANKMEGTVTSYSSLDGALVVNISSVTGSGTYASWIISTSSIDYSPGVIDIKTTGNITVNSGGLISANGKGFSGGTDYNYDNKGKGPGGGSGAGGGSGVGAGGYGGVGGRGYQASATGGVTYGSETNPIHLGSGGGCGYPSGIGGNGGGAIKLEVSGILDNSGIISADGNSGTTNTNAGPGSGGSIWVICGTLQGNGRFSSKGGVGSPLNNYLGSGGGGGGRISLQPTNYDTYAGDIIVSGANGGYGGGTGTLVRDPALSLGTVTISGTVTWTRGTHTFKELIISSGATLTSGEAVAGAWSYAGSGVGLGPGVGGYFGGGGAGHSGAGRAGYSSAGGSAYNSDELQETSPTDLGSSGGGTGNGPSGNNLSGYGGGALKIDVSSGALVNNGIISVSAGSAPSGGAGGAGGGSGGSLWVVANNLSGSGTFLAQGGSGVVHVNGGGAGSGGRIAIYYVLGSDPTALTNVSGGATGYQSLAGTAGTVHIAQVANVPVINLAQYQKDGVTPIGIGGASASQYAVFKLIMTATSAQNLTPQVEVKEVGDDFDGENITSGLPVAYGGTDPVTGIVDYMGLKFDPATPKSYHWRGRIKYADGSFSDWVSFGSNEESTADIKGAIGTNITANETWVTDKTYTNLYIGNNATVTVDSVNKTGGAGQIVLTVDNLWVDSGATISSDAKGYRGGTSNGWSQVLTALGDGASLWGQSSSGGAGYGGVGGNSGQDDAAGGTTYGSNTAPVDLGSGAGAAAASYGGAGGGAIKIVASGGVTNNGTITANGGDGIVQPEQVASRGAGGGSGGSIWVIANIIDGSGVFSAKGGVGFSGSDATRYSGGGGGGGRISLNPSYTDRFIGDITVEPGNGGQGGIGGTIYRPASSTPASVTLIRNIVWSHGEHAFANLTIPAGITLSAGMGTGRTLAYAPNGQTAYAGAGGGGITEGWSYGSGAGHGGAGGLSGVVVGGLAYDSESAPVYYGSSGATGWGAVGGYGGGALKLTITEALTINGIISANGQSGTTSGGYSGGGGSGGSIWLNAANILGTSGTITATGGAGGAGDTSRGYASGGGAGGRIAATSPNESDISWNVSSMSFPVTGGAAGACPGCSYTPAAAPGGVGTLYGIGPMASITNPNPLTTTFYKNSFTIQGTAFSPASVLTGVQVLIQNTTLGTYWNGSNWVAFSDSWQNVTQVSGWASWSYASPTFPADTNHSYTITVLAKDEIFPTGGPVRATANIVYDTVVPVIQSVTLEPSSGYRKLGDTVTITVTPSAAEPNSGLLTPSTVTFNGRSITLTPASSNSGPFTGTYTVTDGDVNVTNPSATGVTLTDSAGNVSGEGSSAASTLVIDSYKPVISSVALSPASGYRKIGDTVTITATVTHNEANLSGAAKVLSSSTATFNGQSVAVATGPTGASSPYTFTYIYTVAEGDGDAVNAEASNIVITDASGNASDAGSSSSNTVIIDSTKPVVSDAHISISSSPANGVVYLVGEQVTARWDNSASGDNNSDIASVTCDFSALGGNSAVAMSASNGIYTASYTVATDSITGTHAIAITAVDTAGNQRLATDSTQITIASGSLTLTSPNTAVSYKAGTTQQITWTAGGDVSRVSLMYSTDSGDNYKIINTVGSITGNNSYSWTVPSDVTSSARVKVEDAVIPQVYSASSVDFTIAYPAITITSPNGGEFWPAGSTQNITWTTDSSAVTHVKLEYSIDGGSSWNLITAATANTGSYSWTLNNLFAIDTVSVRATGLSRNQALTLGGTAAGKVSSSAWIEDGYKTLALQVLTDFSAGDTLVISGIKFGNFSASDADRLRLSVDSGYATDDKTIKVLAPSVYSGGLGDGWAYAESL
ncbi:MAG: hypothetical protein WC293_01110 [Candidatus Omnitrophota bacterium]|jgi:hypothetical protein